MKTLYRGAFAVGLLWSVAASAQQHPQPAEPGAAVPDPTYRSTAYTAAAVATETPDQRWLRANIAVAGGGMGHMMAPPADPHAGHDMTGKPATDPHAGHAMSARPAADPHAGHAMTAKPAADPHAGHDMQPRQEGH